MRRRVMVNKEKSSIILKDGHECVDLGLPSGLLWATCNVGANNPQDYGNYYQWGALTTYQSSDQFLTGSTDITDAKDIAKQTWKGGWRMPTRTEFQELAANCFMEYTSSYNGSGVVGVIFYSTLKNATGKGLYKRGSNWYKLSNNQYSSSTSQPSGFKEYTLDIPHIFLPFAGDYMYGSKYDVRTMGYYWSRTRSSTSNAYCMRVASSVIAPQGSYSRSSGFSIRPII